jgi:Ca2+-binding EF-hand superfamily protein
MKVAPMAAGETTDDAAETLPQADIPPADGAADDDVVAGAPPPQNKRSCWPWSRATAVVQLDPAALRAVEAANAREKHLHDMWNKFDADGGGSLDRGEIRDVLRAMGKDVSDAEFEVAMQEIDADGSGHVEFHEFQQWWNGQGFDEQERLAAQMKKQEDILTRAWARFDDDGGGTLGVREIRLLLKAIGRDVTDAAFGMVMEELDEDNSGQCDFDEFQEWWQKQDDEVHARMEELDELERLKEIWSRFDVDGDGMLGAQEILAVLRSVGRKVSAEGFKAAMQEIDADGSGEADFDEFASWWRTQGATVQDELADADGLAEEFGADVGARPCERS